MLTVDITYTEYGGDGIVFNDGKRQTRVDYKTAWYLFTWSILYNRLYNSVAFTTPMGFTIYHMYLDEPK